MIEKIKDVIFFKYGIKVSSKQIWIVTLLFMSLCLLFLALFINSNEKTVLPDDSLLETDPNMPPRLKTK